MDVLNNLEPITTLKKALDIVQGISSPGKMPVPAYNLPIDKCRTGSILRALKKDKKGRITVCSNCYAGKGNYKRYEKNILPALYRRLESINNPRWVDAFVYILTHQKQIKQHKVFRWHDSGDIQSPDHLEKIVQIAKRTPHIKHWLPTKESGDIKNYKGKIPKNLVVRLSGTFVDGKPPTYTHTSIATSDVDRVTCLASLPKDHPNTQEGCQDCRQCWDSNVKNIAYYNH